VASEAARGEVLLCQPRPRSDLVVRNPRADGNHGAWRAGRVGDAAGDGWLAGAADDSRVPCRSWRVPDNSSTSNVPLANVKRVPVVAANAMSVEIEVRELEPGALVRAHGPFESPSLGQA
jgi:hypothetical protein